MSLYLADAIPGNLGDIGDHESADDQQRATHSIRRDVRCKHDSKDHRQPSMHFLYPGQTAQASALLVLGLVERQRLRLRLPGQHAVSVQHMQHR